MADFSDLKSFIAFLIFKHYQFERQGFLKKSDGDFDFSPRLLEKNFPSDFWEKVLLKCKVTDRCKCNQSDYKVCASVYLECKNQRNLFKSSHVVLNSNIGFFVFHTDENGRLKECEMLFEENVVPDFIFKLVEIFPSQNRQSDLSFVNVLKEREIYSVKDLKNAFALRKLNRMEIN